MFRWLPLMALNVNLCSRVVQRLVTEKFYLVLMLRNIKKAGCKIQRAQKPENRKPAKYPPKCANDCSCWIVCQYFKNLVIFVPVCSDSDFIRDIDHHKENYLKEGDNSQKKRALFQIQRLLVKCQEIGDEKLQLVAAVLEHIESRTRQLEADRENLGTCMAALLKWHADTILTHCLCYLKRNVAISYVYSDMQ